jgi:hypothetical protein
MQYYLSSLVINAKNISASARIDDVSPWRASA